MELGSWSNPDGFLFRHVPRFTIRAFQPVRFKRLPRRSLNHKARLFGLDFTAKLDFIDRGLIANRRNRLCRLCCSVQVRRHREVVLRLSLKPDGPDKSHVARVEVDGAAVKHFHALGGFDEVNRIAVEPESREVSTQPPLNLAKLLL